MYAWCDAVKLLACSYSPHAFVAAVSRAAGSTCTQHPPGHAAVESHRYQHVEPGRGCECNSRTTVKSGERQCCCNSVRQRTKGRENKQLIPWKCSAKRNSCCKRTGWWSHPPPLRRRPAHRLMERRARGGGGWRNAGWRLAGAAGDLRSAHVVPFVAGAVFGEAGAAVFGTAAL